MELKIRINYSNEYLKTYEEFLTRPNMHYDGTLPIEKRTTAIMSWNFPTFRSGIRARKRMCFRM